MSALKDATAKGKAEVAQLNGEVTKAKGEARVLTATREGELSAKAGVTESVCKRERESE